MVGSFYDPTLDEGCAFEELISFHGGLGGPQTRPFILHPPGLELPDEPLIGAEAVHALLLGWRRSLAAAASRRAGRAPRPRPAAGAASPRSSSPAMRAQATASAREVTPSLR